MNLLKSKVLAAVEKIIQKEAPGYEYEIRYETSEISLDLLNREFIKTTVLKKHLFKYVWLME